MESERRSWNKRTRENLVACDAPNTRCEGVATNALLANMGFECPNPLEGFLANRMVSCTRDNVGGEGFESPLDVHLDGSELCDGFLCLSPKTTNLGVTPQVLDSLGNESRHLNLLARSPTNIAVKTLVLCLAHVLEDTARVVGMSAVQLEARIGCCTSVIEVFHLHCVLTDTTRSGHLH